MRAYEIINEVADQPYRYMLAKKLPYASTYIFQNDSGSRFVVFIELETWDRGTVADVGFTDQTVGEKPTIGVTGKGDAFRVFATVGAIVNEYVKAVKPDFMSFSGKTHDPGRIKLYDMIAKNIGRYLRGYQLLSSRVVKAVGTTDDKNYVFQRVAAESLKETSDRMSVEDMIAYLRKHHSPNLHPDYIDHINTFSGFELKNIPVSAIKTDLPMLDQDKVERYKKMDFSKAPPIVIGDGYILDGYHRANVARSLGIPTIKAYVGVKKTAESIMEGGWDNKITQGTVIRPSTVKKVLVIMATFVDEFNQFLETRDIPPIRLGHPTGSSAYHDVDPEDSIYGDIDLQIVVPELPELADKTTSQIQGYWYKLMDEFIKTHRPVYVHPISDPGHPIVQVDSDAWVQVDIMPHPVPLATWGRYRVTPERGVKGMLNGNMFSVLGEMLMMSIQHAGVQFKERGGQKLPYTKTRKDYKLVTLTTDVTHFVRDIFDHEYELITGRDPSTAKVDPLLVKHPGSDLEDIKISNLVNAVKGLASSFEANGMYGKGDLAGYANATDFLNKFWAIYEGKAMKDINAGKRDKAETPEAKARAQADKDKILNGLKMVKGLFAH